jgi:hypothetical protein
MKKFLIGLTKLAAACSGPACVLYGINRFEKFFSEGEEAANETHTALINNHGVFRYITESQNQSYHFFLGLGAVLILATAAAIFLTRNRGRLTRS